MQDTVMTIIAIIVAGIIIFGFSLLGAAEIHNNTVQSVASKAVQDFVLEVSATGTISQDEYSKLVAKLESTGNKFLINMEVQKLDSNAGKKTQWINHNVVGENSTFSVYSQQIAESLKKNGKYTLKEGDRFSVSVRNTNRTLSQSFKALIFSGSKEASEIQANHSALVTATGIR